mgnify:CR=1 FL=1
MLFGQVKHIFSTVDNIGIDLDDIWNDYLDEDDEVPDLDYPDIDDLDDSLEEYLREQIDFSYGDEESYGLEDYPDIDDDDWTIPKFADIIDANRGGKDNTKDNRNNSTNTVNNNTLITTPNTANSAKDNSTNSTSNNNTNTNSDNNINNTTPANDSDEVEYDAENESLADEEINQDQLASIIRVARGLLGPDTKKTDQVEREVRKIISIYRYWYFSTTFLVVI